MIKSYRDYYWKKGKPQGKEIVTHLDQEPCAYKIVPDPYFRRFSIEKYVYGRFIEIVYDSFLFDFRHLKPEEQAAWQKELLEENHSTIKCLLRNQDDRAVLFETYHFENGLCRSCFIQSIHGLPLAKSEMYYRRFGDAFDGVVLYDKEGRPVMMKTYEIDPLTGEFTNLLTEEWEMSQIPEQIRQVKHG